ncbi:alpha/beta hydrolase [Mycobacterium sp.]|uniref:alpha/beta hydrolase n=1 Tax=Mycobacterium sp. TaxID=1785 RepID=UPI002BF47764|nr:alpha/beta hydrolase [Mycobacterium sp.]HTQ22061.1 alpha/beta hydrolase [Mycobacterium sp.]
MSLSLAEIEQWSSDAVREVFHVGNVRAGAAFDAGAGLGQLRVFDSWGGAGAEAARKSIDQVRADLNSHGEEALAVAQVASKASGEIDELKRDLQALLAAADAAQMQIDPKTNAIGPAPGSHMSPQEIDGKTTVLAQWLKRVLSKAAAIDMELAQAIEMAEGNRPIPAGPHDNRPEIREALSRPLPEDPKQFHDLWQQLNPEEKDWLYSQDHNIGNHPGMPWDPEDHLGRDHYDRMHLTELRQHTQADLDRMQQRYDQLAAQAYLGDHSKATAVELNALGPQISAARQSLQGYRTVQAELDRNDGVKRYLGLIDDKGHGAVAIGNPDYAKRNAILVPGTGQDLTKFEGSDLKSLAMYNAAMQADPTLRPGDVAVTTWMGYDRPMDLPQAAWPDRAWSGGGALDAFESGQRASHVGAPSIDTVIGHSYGSTVVGAAAAPGHHLDANNVIAVGSPGMLVHNAGDLNLAPGGTVYAMRARNDIIELVTDLTLGKDPMGSEFGATRLYAAPGPSSDPLGLTPSVAAHSSYWLPGNPALRNFGAVIDGMQPPEIIGPDGTVEHR